MQIIGQHAGDPSLKRGTCGHNILPGTPLFGNYFLNQTSHTADADIGTYVGLSSTFLAGEGEATGLDGRLVWMTFSQFTGRSGNSLMLEEALKDSQQISCF
jgi:hypothetical protein